MARPPEEDARGIVAPDRGLRRFTLERHDPSPDVARLVDWYWIVTWDLDTPFEQPVLAHPVVNVVFGDGPPTVWGPPTRIGSRVLDGRGRVLGVMFRPAGYRPLLDGPMRTLVDRRIPYPVDLEPDPRTVDAHLVSLVPHERQPSEDTTAIVERIAADPTLTRVAALADELGVTERQLQRRFADHVGLSPKTVMRRYRLYEAAEAARSGTVDWAAVAAELGYSDQAHLSRDFTAALGTPPARYASLATVDDPSSRSPRSSGRSSAE